MPPSAIVVTTVDYASEGESIRRIRDQVFVFEQGVPSELEHDEQDPGALHVLAVDDGIAVGTGRITPEGKIGRMAVLASHRGRGVGQRILEALLAIAQRQKLAEVYCFAQCHAIPFYERMGFTPEGPVFLEAGIEHRRMFRPVDR